MTRQDTRAVELYEQDFFTWTERQARAIRKAAQERLNTTEPIDWANAAEEIESLGKEQLFRLDSACPVLRQRLLTWRHQPRRRSRSWQLTIAEQRRRIRKIIEGNLGLHPRRDAVFQGRARRCPQARRSGNGIGGGGLP